MGYFVQDGLCRNLVHDVISDVDDIQQSSSLALSAALKQHPNITDEILQQLIEVYKRKLKVFFYSLWTFHITMFAGINIFGTKKKVNLVALSQLKTTAGRSKGRVPAKFFILGLKIRHNARYSDTHQRF